MSNTGKKILILATVIVIAVAGILAFYPTIVAPPNKVATENLHIKDLSSSINGFSTSQTYVYNDSVYNTVTDKIGLYLKEGFLTDEETDSQVKSFVQKYIPVFVDLCYKKFNASKWIESDHTAIRERIKELKTFTVDNGETKVVTGSFLTDLGNIDGIIDTYYEAKKAASFSSFVSVSDANSKITKAENYRNMPYIKNCTDLVNKLAAVKVNIGNSHYSYLEGQVSTLRNYRNMTKAEFRDQANSVNSKIQEYENNMGKYGSSAKDTRSLKERAAEYYREAVNYYERPEISIDTNGQWISMTSPSSLYRAYQSSSNWHRASTNATMSFTIRGYSSFTFKIRSYGEGNYDYVMVALNKQPTRDSNFSNTMGAPSSYSYKDVTFSGLDRSTSYTIYVTYTKDSSNDSGDDRGYVLIPYESN